ncbi:MAG: helix-turn-helix domain-containing protein [Rickettsiales bacterium]|jgi:hypothetical protein|nr:helix-turn-helix domain-containing protein [Rickettsiales bacterium]
MAKKQIKNIRDFKGVWMPKSIYLNENLNWTEKILLIEIDSLDDGKGCFASNKYFSEFLGVTERSITAAIANLKKLRFIEQTSFDGRIRKLKANANAAKQMKETEEKIEEKTEKKIETNEVQNMELCPEENFHSESNLSSAKTRSLLLGSNNSINNIMNNTKNNKKDKSFLEKDNSFSNKNSNSNFFYKDFNSFNSLETEEENIKELENDEKGSNRKLENDRELENSEEEDNRELEIDEEKNELENCEEEDREEDREEEEEGDKQRNEEQKELNEESKEETTNNNQNKHNSIKELNKQIFGFGTMLLNEIGHTDLEARRIIGKWLKTGQREELFEFIKQALTDKIVDPAAWITKQLEKQTKEFQEKKKQETQQKYNDRKEELEEEYTKTHNGEYSETKIQNYLQNYTQSVTQSLDPDLHRNKILLKILKPMFHYYGTCPDGEVINLFCKSLSSYNYGILTEIRDELLTEYKTFPKLPEWLKRCERKTKPDIANDNGTVNNITDNTASNAKSNKENNTLNNTLNNTTSLTTNKELQELINLNNNQNKNWIYVKQRCKEEMGINVYNCWILYLNLLEETNDKTILVTDNSFARDYINRNYLNGVEKKLSSGDTIWLRRGITEFWKEANQNIEKIEIKTIREIEREIESREFNIKNMESENQSEKSEIKNQNKNQNEGNSKNQSENQNQNENQTEANNPNNPTPNHSGGEDD